MTDAEYWKQEAQNHADAIRDDAAREPFGAELVPTFPPVAVLYGKGSAPFRDDEVAREAVEVLRERFDGLGVRELADAVNAHDGSTWTIIVRSPNRPIEAKIDQLSNEVERAYRIARQQE